MIDSTVSPAVRGSNSGFASHCLGWLDGVAYTWLAIPLRLAVATVFWRSAMAHLANMQTTLYMFENMYHVPLLPPDFAAYLTVSIEVSAPILLVLGVLTRLTSLVLLGMVAVIEIFVFPQAWPTHIQWFAMLLVLLFRGSGALSIDWLVRRWLFGPNHSET
ncbi:MAG: DoxX family protein [Acetobacteraceae bacterium]